MIDLHTHILPGVDDGPDELAVALEMARVAVTDGIRVMVATPHAFGGALNVAPEDRDQSLMALQAELERLGIPLRLVPGFECQVTDILPKTLTEHPEYLYPWLGQDAPNLARYVLVELNDDLPVTCLDSMLFRLRIAGITPLLAHPERHPEIRKRVSCIEGFVRNGGKLQITAGGLLGDGGWRERRVCEKLLRQGLVAVLATDAHGVEEAGALSKGLARATKLIGSAASDLVTSGPQDILGLV